MTRDHGSAVRSVPVEAFVRLPHSWCGASLDGILQVAEAAEALGFAGVSVQDHILSGKAVAPCGHRHLEDDRMVLEPLTTLSFVAARTSRVRLLTGVLVLPFRHPIWVAKTAGTLDVLFRDHSKTVYSHLHFSVYGKSQQQKIDEAVAIHGLLPHSG